MAREHSKACVISVGEDSIAALISDGSLKRSQSTEDVTCLPDENVAREYGLGDTSMDVTMFVDSTDDGQLALIAAMQGQTKVTVTRTRGTVVETGSFCVTSIDESYSKGKFIVMKATLEGDGAFEAASGG